MYIKALIQKLKGLNLQAFLSVGVFGTLDGDMLCKFVYQCPNLILFNQLFINLFILFFTFISLIRTFEIYLIIGIVEFDEQSQQTVYKVELNWVSKCIFRAGIVKMLVYLRQEQIMTFLIG